MSIVRYCLLGLLGLFLLAIWVVAAAANFAHGMQWAGLSPWAPVIGILSVAGDGVKAAAFLGMAAAGRKGRWGAVLACLLIWAPATVWSMWSCTGFAATILTDTMAGRSMHTVADKSLLKQIDDQVAQVTKLQDLKMRSSPRDWDRIEGEIGRTETRIESLRTRARSTQTVGAADPTGDLLAFIGVTPEGAKFGRVLTFLLLVELGSNLGLLAFTPLFGTRHDEIAEGVAGALSDTPPPAPPLKGDGKLKLVPASPLRLQALELLAELEVKHGAGSAIETAKVWNAYLAYAAARQCEPMASNKLGQQLALLGVTKTDADSQKRKYYVLPTAQERAAKHAKGKEGGGLPVA